jgi:hypothetical protein
MAAEPRRATANRAARASLALLAVRLGLIRTKLIRTKLIRTRQWRSADRPEQVGLGLSGDQKPRVRRQRSISDK